jgi:lipoprotein signal peptidase
LQLCFDTQQRAQALLGSPSSSLGPSENTLDRIRFGAVVDLFDASKLGFIWIFNVADVSIDVGIALLLLASFLPRSGS